MPDRMLMLSWNSHHAAFCDILSRHREKGSFTDVTLACESKFYPLHKLVLSSCSEYLEQIFEKTPCKHPVIVLNDMRCSELEALLSYMYIGEVSVPQSTLPLLIKAAELLQIKGLAVPDTPPLMSRKKVNACIVSEDQTRPQAKRQKYEESNTTSHKEQSQGSSNSSSTTSALHSKESNYTSKHSNILLEDTEQEQLGQDVNELQASEEPPLCYVENVYAETDIKEEVVDNIDNTSSMVMCVPELNYPSHGSSCNIKDIRGTPVTKDICSLPLSEDYKKQPLDYQRILPHLKNIPDLAVNSTELHGGALGELPRVNRHSRTGLLESSCTMTTLQGTPQQEQEMVDAVDQLKDEKNASRPWEDTGILKKHFECSLCSQSFTSRSLLSVHIRKHGKKPFLCSYCSKRFMHNSGLKIHLRSHTGERPFSCPFCNHRSTQSGALKIHVQTHFK